MLKLKRKLQKKLGIDNSPIQQKEQIHWMGNYYEETKEEKVKKFKEENERRKEES